PKRIPIPPFQWTSDHPASGRVPQRRPVLLLPRLLVRDAPLGRGLRRQAFEADRLAAIDALAVASFRDARARVGDLRQLFLVADQLDMLDARAVALLAVLGDVLHLRTL